MLDIGNRVAGFEIEAWVARGGMAVVYRAREVGLGGRVVALKVIAPELAEDETFRHRFTQESHLAASIDHPNIIPIYAAGEADGQLYLVMRYVDGETLGAVFKDQGPLAPADALAIFAQVAGALDAAHAHELVHRDVKPKNILLVGKGELARRHVYLSDFGLTKRVTSDTSVTTAGQFLGTIRYVAPEQISKAPISHQTDIYSLACVIFEALTGQPPFDSNDEAATLWSHMSQNPPSASQRRPGLPVAVDDVLRRALAKNPAQRQPTCQTLIAELRAALDPSSATGPAAETVLLSTPGPADPEPYGAGSVEGPAAFSGSYGAVETAPQPDTPPLQPMPEPVRVPAPASTRPTPQSAAAPDHRTGARRHRGRDRAGRAPGPAAAGGRPIGVHLTRHRRSPCPHRPFPVCRSRPNHWPTTSCSGGTSTAGSGPSPPCRSSTETNPRCWSAADRTGASS